MAEIIFFGSIGFEINLLKPADEAAQEMQQEAIGLAELDEMLGLN